MNVEVNNYEEECGKPCTPNGCCGHDTRIPESITIDGFTLTLEGFINGDWPFLDEDGAEIPGEVERWKSTVQRIVNNLRGGVE